VSGHLPPDHPGSLVDWTALGRLRGTLVLLMAIENLPAIAAHLVAHGRAGDTPVALVENGTLPAERVVVTTLARVADVVRAEGVRAPAIVVVGAVVAHRRPAGPPAGTAGSG